MIETNHLIEVGYLDYEGEIWIAKNANNNAAESANNTAKAILKAKRGVSRKYL